MDPAIQGNNSGAPPDVPVKRKRGRPRKDRSLNLVRAPHRSPIQTPRLIPVQTPRPNPVVTPRPNRGVNARAPLGPPPGFEGVNRNQPRQVPNDGGKDVMEGQVVSGVIEASFDAGYLLTVRVGNSDTILRGVVFKPGRYVPVSEENDVVPNLQMIRRNEVHGNNSRSRENANRYRNRSSNEAATATPPPPPPPPPLPLQPAPGNQLVRVATPRPTKPAPPVQTVLPVIPRAKIVPVVLQPVNLANGLPSATPAPHLASSKGKQLPPLPLQASPLSNGSSTQSALVFASPPQTSRNVATTSTPNEGEVIKRIQGPSQSAKTQIKNTKPPSSFTREREIPNINEPLSIKHLQAVQSNPHQQSVPVPSEGTGRMTELLQVLQENMTESEGSAAETGSTIPFHDLRNPGDESCPPKKRSRATSV